MSAVSCSRVRWLGQVALSVGLGHGGLVYGQPVGLLGLSLLVGEQALDRVPKARDGDVELGEVALEAVEAADDGAHGVLIDLSSSRRGGRRRRVHATTSCSLS